MSRLPLLRLLSPLLLLLIFCLVASRRLAAWQDAPLTIASDSLPSATVGTRYAFDLRASGGVSPYGWRLAEGAKHPPGLHLQRRGRLTGTLTEPGEYHFTIVLSDAAAPPSQVQRQFTLVVLAGLTIEWKRPPKVSGAWIAGSIVVANHTDAPADLTVIVEAVNQIGRATVLGYRHFTIEAQADQEIPFGSSPGEGAYTVHADAIAHFSAPERTLRARKQTGESELVIQQI